MSDDATTTRALLEFGSALVHEAAGRVGALGTSIRPMWHGARAAGRCRTVLIGQGDNLGVHHAIEHALEAEILCIAGSTSDFGIWGEITTRSAMARGVAGLVTSAGVRDLDEIRRLGFPVFAAASALQGTAKEIPGMLNATVLLGQSVISSGDWLVGDSDGCVVIKASSVSTVIDRARLKQADERRVLALIEEGMSSREALALPAL